MGPASLVTSALVIARLLCLYGHVVLLFSSPGFAMNLPVQGMISDIFLGNKKVGRDLPQRRKIRICTNKTREKGGG